MKHIRWNFAAALLTLCSVVGWSAQAHGFGELEQQFARIYQQQLGVLTDCPTTSPAEIKLCSDALRNEGNAPFILHHNHVTDKVVVLFHGLSDSPYFLRSIATALHAQGYNVMVGLLPGHGQKDADKDMQDPTLAKRWRTRVAELMALADGLAKRKYIGGFSTGGALATEYVLQNPQGVSGLLLFSGALQLTAPAENLADVWGMRWVAKQMDGDYATEGRNPYKYPAVSTYAAFQLVDVIKHIRKLMAQNQPLATPLFVAHSEADETTLIEGVEDLMAYNRGDNQFFAIPQSLDVCHADVVISQQQLFEMRYDSTGLTEPEPCSVPQANPQHAQMLAALIHFLQDH